MAAGLATVLAPSAAASIQGRQRAAGCPLRGRHTVIAADPQAEVYGIRKNEEEVVYWGCVYGHARSFEVGFTDECISNGGACAGTSYLTLAGTLLAREYSRTSFVFGEEWLVEVEDLRTGRVLHSVPTGMTRTGNPKIIGAGPITAIVVKSDGAVAWINEKPVPAGTEYEVHALDKSGERVLALGTNIAPRSLALAGSTLYWTQGGKPYSATLN
jgi:hypothetical protein